MKTTILSAVADVFSVYFWTSDGGIVPFACKRAFYAKNSQKFKFGGLIMENNNVNFATFLKQYPDKNGYFGRYGGAYLPDELVPAFNEINDAYQTICKSSKFIQELRRIRKEFQGRPTPVYHCDRLSKSVGKCQIYLKREDLNHTGAHKLNHCMGEGLLASFMGKKNSLPKRARDNTASLLRRLRRISG